MLKENCEYRVQDYTNRWSLIDQMEGYGLLENNTWGDETCYLVVKMDQEPLMKKYYGHDGSVVYLPTIQEVVCETYDGLEVALEDEGLMVDGQLVGKSEGSLDQVIQDCETLSKNNAKEKIDLSEYEMMPSQVEGFDIYRKVVWGEDGLPRGVWAAQKEGEEPFKITYNQALGREPIEDSRIKSLSRKLGEMLLP